MIKKNTARPQDAVCFRGVRGIKSPLVKAGLCFTQSARNETTLRRARLRSKGGN